MTTTCVICTKHIEEGRRNAKTCGEPCRTIRTNRLKAAWREAHKIDKTLMHITGICVICGGAFTATGTGSTNQKTCPPPKPCRAIHYRNLRARPAELKPAFGHEAVTRTCLKCDDEFQTDQDYRLCLSCRTYADNTDGYGYGAIA